MACDNRNKSIRLSGNVFRNMGLTEVLLVLGAIFVIIGGIYAWHEHNARNFPGPRSALRFPARDIPPLFGLAIAPDERTAVAVGIESTFQMYDLQTRMCSAQPGTPGLEMTNVNYSPDGNSLLVGMTTGEIEIWNTRDMHLPPQSFKAHEGRITFQAFHPDGRSFVTSGADLRTIVWDAQTLKPVFELPPVVSAIRSGSFLAAGTFLVTGSTMGKVLLWDMTTQQLVSTTTVTKASHPRDSIVEGVVILSDETEVLVATRNGEIGVWNLRQGTRKLKYGNAGRLIVSLCLLQDGTRAVTGGNDGFIQIWDVSNGRCVKTIAAHAGSVHSVAGIDNGRVLVSTGYDGIAKFWDL